jgi:hypothetical protein
MAKTIIVLQGVGNAGKSTTIGMLLDLLIQVGWEEVEYLRGQRGNVNFAVILKHGKTKMGICTWGDNIAQLNPYLPRFSQEQCKLIVCAMRTRGGTVEYVESFAKTNGFVLDRIPKNRTDDPANYKKENCKVAKQINQLIEKEISE